MYMDLADVWGHVLAVMLQPDFRQQLVQRLNVERSLIETRENLEKCFLQHLLEIDSRVIAQDRKLFSIFEESVIAKLPQPPVLTADDLQRLALAHLGGMREENAEELVFRFISFVLLEINNYSVGRRLDFGCWTPTDPPQDENQILNRTVCDLPNGFGELCIEVEESPYEQCRAYGRLLSNGTTSAISQVTAKVGPLIESLVRSLRLSATTQEMAPAMELWLEWAGVSGWLTDDGELVGEMAGPVDPPIRWLLSQHIFLLIDSAMTCLFAESTFANRIKNAMTFAHYAESHSNEAISLSFCVSAIEALLCEGKDDKVDQLRARIPALLQFQCSSKMHRRVGHAIGGLYTVRSECLHGSRINASTQQLQAARRLMSAILRGTLEWSIQDRVVGNVPTDEGWSAELRKATGDGKTFGIVPGVTKDLSENVGEFLRSFSIDDD